MICIYIYAHLHAITKSLVWQSSQASARSSAYLHGFAYDYTIYILILSICKAMDIGCSAMEIIYFTVQPISFTHK